MITLDFLIVPVLIVVTLIFESLTFYYKDSDNENLWHLLLIPTFACFMLAVWFGKDYYQLHILVILYVFYRFAFYDTFYTILAYRKILIYDTNNWYDKFFAKFPIFLTLFVKAIVLTTAISITFRYVN